MDLIGKRSFQGGVLTRAQKSKDLLQDFESNMSSAKARCHSILPLWPQDKITQVVKNINLTQKGMGL